MSAKAFCALALISFKAGLDFLYGEEGTVPTLGRKAGILHEVAAEALEGIAGQAQRYLLQESLLESRGFEIHTAGAEKEDIARFQGQGAAL